MALRGYADVPNRVVRLFLQEVGLQYDANRGLPRFRYSKLPPEVLTWFKNACAYCGGPPPLVEEHVVPMNRKLVGLHAWGNIVPACKDCNNLKSPMDNRGETWHTHPKLNAKRRNRIEDFATKYNYAPIVSDLKVVMEKLYLLTDQHTRALVGFGVSAAHPYIAGLHLPLPQADQA
jgi:hypothetical protein